MHVVIGNGRNQAFVEVVTDCLSRIRGVIGLCGGSQCDRAGDPRHSPHETIRPLSRTVHCVLPFVFREEVTAESTVFSKDRARSVLRMGDVGGCSEGAGRRFRGNVLRLRASLQPLYPIQLCQGTIKRSEWSVSGLTRNLKNETI